MGAQGGSRTLQGESVSVVNDSHDEGTGLNAQLCGVWLGGVASACSSSLCALYNLCLLGGGGKHGEKRKEHQGRKLLPDLSSVGISRWCRSTGPGLRIPCSIGGAKGPLAARHLAGSGRRPMAVAGTPWQAPQLDLLTLILAHKTLQCACSLYNRRLISSTAVLPQESSLAKLVLL